MYCEKDERLLATLRDTGKSFDSSYSGVDRFTLNSGNGNKNTNNNECAADNSCDDNPLLQSLSALDALLYETDMQLASIIGNNRNRNDELPELPRFNRQVSPGPSFNSLGSEEVRKSIDELDAVLQAYGEYDDISIYGSTFGDAAATNNARYNRLLSSGNSSIVKEILPLNDDSIITLGRKSVSQETLSTLSITDGTALSQTAVVSAQNADVYLQQAALCINTANVISSNHNSYPVQGDNLDDDDEFPVPPPPEFFQSVCNTSQSKIINGNVSVDCKSMAKPFVNQTAAAILPRIDDHEFTLISQAQQQAIRTNEKNDSDLELGFGPVGIPVVNMESESPKKVKRSNSECRAAVVPPPNIPRRNPSTKLSIVRSFDSPQSGILFEQTLDTNETNNSSPATSPQQCDNKISDDNKQDEAPQINAAIDTTSRSVRDIIKGFSSSSNIAAAESGINNNNTSPEPSTNTVMRHATIGRSFSISSTNSASYPSNISAGNKQQSPNNDHQIPTGYNTVRKLSQDLASCIQLRLPSSTPSQVIKHHSPGNTSAKNMNQASSEIISSHQAKPSQSITMHHELSSNSSANIIESPLKNNAQTFSNHQPTSTLPLQTFHLPNNSPQFHSSAISSTPVSQTSSCVSTFSAAQRTIDSVCSPYAISTIAKNNVNNNSVGVPFSLSTFSSGSSSTLISNNSDNVYANLPPPAQHFAQVSDYNMVQKTIDFGTSLSAVPAITTLGMSSTFLVSNSPALSSNVSVTPCVPPSITGLTSFMAAMQNKKQKKNSKHKQQQLEQQQDNIGGVQISKKNSKKTSSKQQLPPVVFSCTEISPPVAPPLPQIIPNGDKNSNHHNTNLVQQLKSQLPPAPPGPQDLVIAQLQSQLKKVQSGTVGSSNNTSAVINSESVCDNKMSKFANVEHHTVQEDHSKHSPEASRPHSYLTPARQATDKHSFGETNHNTTFNVKSSAMSVLLAKAKEYNVDVTTISGYQVIPEFCVEWKRALIEKKNTELIETYLAEKEEEERNSQKWQNIPQWRKDLLEKKVKKKEEELQPILEEKRKKEADEAFLATLPEWKRNLIVKKTSSNQQQ